MVGGLLAAGGTMRCMILFLNGNYDILGREIIFTLAPGTILNGFGNFKIIFSVWVNTEVRKIL